MSATVNIIKGDECIGDSLTTINNNFHELSMFIAPDFTAPDIASRTNTVNTVNKRVGRIIYDRTNHRLMVASGSNDNSPWYVVDGSISVTPV